MGSFFETELVLFCIKNNYLSALNEDKNEISPEMERILQIKYIEGFTIKKENQNYELKRCSGPHSEFQNYFLSKTK